MASRNPEPRGQVVRGTKNVFADLGFPDADERQVKLRLAYCVTRLLDRRKLSQAEAAKALGLPQAKIHALRDYKLGVFSLGRLMTLLTALDQDVEIVVRRRPRSRRAARLFVAGVDGERTVFDKAGRRALRRLREGLDLQWSPSSERGDAHRR